MLPIAQVACDEVRSVEERIFALQLLTGQVTAEVRAALCLLRPRSAEGFSIKRIIRLDTQGTAIWNERRRCAGCTTKSKRDYSLPAAPIKGTIPRPHRSQGAVSSCQACTKPFELGSTAAI